MLPEPRRRRWCVAARCRPAPAPGAPAAPGAAQAQHVVAPPSAGRRGPADVAAARERRGCRGGAEAATRPRVTGITPSQSRCVSAAQAEAIGPSVGPGSDAEQSADPTDYSVAKDDTIRVATDETLGHFADWLGQQPAAPARPQPHERARQCAIGERLKLEFQKRDARGVRERRRKDYHRACRPSYFAAHRIVGTQVYIARSGDSLWTLTQRGGQLPLWLLQQYNPAWTSPTCGPAPRS